MPNYNYNQNYSQNRPQYKANYSRIVSYIVLVAAIFYANYLGNNALILGILSNYGIADWGIIIITNIVVVIIQAGIFELIGRILFNYVYRATKFSAFTCQKEQFMDVLRWFYIIRCVILGSLYLLVYVFNFLLPLADLVFNSVISIAVYFVFFFWLKRLNYLNTAVIHKTFLYLAVITILYYALVLILNFV